MPAIISLKALGSERFEISLDNGESVLTRLSVVADFSLYSGRILTDGEYSAVRDASEFENCKARAFRLIGMRPMSVRELKDRLVLKGEREAVAGRCCNRLVELGLLNDAEYSKMLARHLFAKGFGEKKIRDEFYRRGIARELWDEALSELSPPDESLDRLLRAKIKKATRENIRSAAASLARRGFSWENINAAVRRYQSEIKDEEDAG